MQLDHILSTVMRVGGANSIKELQAELCVVFAVVFAVVLVCKDLKHVQVNFEGSRPECYISTILFEYIKLFMCVYL